MSKDVSVGQVVNADLGGATYSVKIVKIVNVPYRQYQVELLYTSEGIKVQPLQYWVTRRQIS